MGFHCEHFRSFPGAQYLYLLFGAAYQTRLLILDRPDSRIAIKQGFDEGVMATLDYLTTQKGYCDHLPVVDFRIIEQLKKEIGI